MTTIGHSTRLTLCTNCGKPTLNRPSRCDKCATAHNASRRALNAAYDRHRDPRSVKFYRSKEWRAARAAVLAAACYQCEDCAKEADHGIITPEEVRVATDVHHRVPLAQAWNLRLTRSNLQALCDRHHKAKRKAR